VAISPLPGNQGMICGVCHIDALVLVLHDMAEAKTTTEVYAIAIRIYVEHNTLVSVRESTR
jgi:hypothetical protein